MNITGWIVVIISAFLTVGVIGGLVAFVVSLFTSRKSPGRRSGGKKARAKSRG